MLQIHCSPEPLKDLCSVQSLGFRFFKSLLLPPKHSLQSHRATRMV